MTLKIFKSRTIGAKDKTKRKVKIEYLEKKAIEIKNNKDFFEFQEKIKHLRNKNLINTEQNNYLLKVAFKNTPDGKKYYKVKNLLSTTSRSMKKQALPMSDIVKE